MNVSLLNYCLACGEENLTPSLNLGLQPLANNYSKNVSDEDNYYPLGVKLCNNCCHLQLTHIVNPKIIYDNYLYVSGTTITLKKYAEWFANYVDEIAIKKYNNILDIGCNDGTQLNYFKDLGYETYGIDPAKNLYELSSKNHKVVCDYFTGSINITTKFDIITAQNVFAHNPNPLEFLLTCKKLMQDHSLLIIQTSQANMVLNNEFDTIYHEHINFFNTQSMKFCVERAGMFLVDAIRTPIHGTSYLFIIGLRDIRPHNIKNAIDLENKLLLKETYYNWEQDITSNMRMLRDMLLDYKPNYKLIGYGAAAKGNTLLNFIGVNLDFIIDDNPFKQGLYTPGLKIPIVDIKILLEIPDNILFIPLAWNFFDEIKSKIKKIRNNPSDVFVKYFPKVTTNV